MIDSVVIPAAGLGTRLFTFTKESPKEMVPIFHRTNEGILLVKPLLEVIFEDLFDFGFRNFCIIVGRGKETIENQLSPHYDFIDLLKRKDEHEYVNILTKLYKKIEKSHIVWKRQHNVKGIGPATLLAKEIIGDKPFLFHSGDLYVPETGYLGNMVDIHTKLHPAATIGIKKVYNPRQYGVATMKKISKNTYKILQVVEKPKNPPTDFALTGINIFEPEIFKAIERTKPGVKGEIQLTDCIQNLLKSGHEVLGSVMNTKDVCIDIGTPKNYFLALQHSYNYNSTDIL